MTFAEAKARYDELYAAAKRASDALQAFPSGPMGLTPDDVKFSPEFMAASAAYRTAAKRSRDYNTWFIKNYAREYREFNRSRRSKVYQAA